MEAWMNLGYRTQDEKCVVRWKRGWIGDIEHGMRNICGCDE